MASTATDSGDLIIAVPPSNFERVASNFSEVFTSPLFSGIETERGIVTEEILEGLDDAGTSVDANDLIRATVFGDHPLGMPITGSIDHVRGFSEDQLHKHHSRYYTGANTVLASAGPLAPEIVKQLLEAEFARVARGSVPSISAPLVQNTARFRYVSHRSSQTQLRLAFRAPGMHDADHAATEVLIRLLDDGMSTRLYHRLCDAKGLCYDVAGNYEAYVDSGLLEFSAETGHERASVVLTELLEMLTELRDTGPTDDELEGVKQRFRWQLDLLLDSVTEAAQFFATELQNGTQRSPMQRWEQINGVSREALIAVAKRWLKASNLTLVAVGTLSKVQLKSIERIVASFT